MTRKPKKIDVYTIRFQSGHIGINDQIRLADGRTYSVDKLQNKQKDKKSWNLAWSRRSTTDGRAFRYTPEEREWIVANKPEAVSRRYGITKAQASNLIYSSRLKKRTRNDHTD